MAGLPTISIVGPGRVGTALGVLAARAGYRVVAVAGRDLARARTAARKIGRGVQAATPAQASGAADIVLLTVPDAAIAPVCEELAAAGTFRRGAIVVHCCGALGSDVLAAAKKKCGCRITSMHPLQTFPTTQAAIAAMPGTYFFIEGDAPAVGPLKKLARAIGGKPMTFRPPKGVSPAAAKAAYHAGACVASNYLVALMDAALAIEALAGIKPADAWGALEKLVQATLRNISALGPAKALTGPISRGDWQTVSKHMKVLARQPKLSPIYTVLGLQTIDVAIRKGTINQDQARALALALTGADGVSISDPKRRHSRRTPKGSVTLQL